MQQMTFLLKQWVSTIIDYKAIQMWLFVGKSENLSVGGIISLQMNIREGGGEIWNTSSSYCDHYLASFILFLQNIPWNDLLIRRQGYHCPKISEPLEEGGDILFWCAAPLFIFSKEKLLAKSFNSCESMRYHIIPYCSISYHIILYHK